MWLKWITLERHYRKYTKKWLIKIQLNDGWIFKEITKEFFLGFPVLNKNVNTTYPNLGEIMKLLLRRNFIALTLKYQKTLK